MCNRSKAGPGTELFNMQVLSSHHNGLCQQLAAAGRSCGSRRMATKVARNC